MDQEIAKDKTANLPEAPKTPVNEEASIAENHQPKFKKRVAVAETE